MVSAASKARMDEKTTWKYSPKEAVAEPDEEAASSGEPGRENWSWLTRFSAPRLLWREGSGLV